MTRTRRALRTGAILGAATLILTLGASPLFVSGADHLDAPSLGHVSVDPMGNVSVVKVNGQLDINDVYVFKSRDRRQDGVGDDRQPGHQRGGRSTQLRHQRDLHVQYRPQR